MFRTAFVALVLGGFISQAPAGTREAGEGNHSRCRAGNLKHDPAVFERFPLPGNGVALIAR